VALPGGHLEHGEGFGDCAGRELLEETNIHVPAADFSVAAVTNDYMQSDQLHYITIFVAAEITGEQAATLKNLEPHKCRDWLWLTWQELDARPKFMPLQHFIEAGHHARFGSVPSS
jgi:8-oxo-dGTP diphosphatase